MMSTVSVRYATLAGVALLALAACQTPAAAPVAPVVASTAVQFHPALVSALAGSWREAEAVARDRWRKPAAALSFWQLRPGMTVLEVSPGGGYWTDILAPFAAQTGGRYIATHADLTDPATSQRAKDNRKAFEDKYAARAATHGRVETVNWGQNSAIPGQPNSVDLVLTSRNIHNFHYNGFNDKAMRDFFAVLKPGGILAIEEHRVGNRPWTEADRSGYMPQQWVIDAALRAGFVLDGSSEVFANPADDTDHPFGVWTLAPSRRTSPFGQDPNPNFDRASFDAIGESDRMALRFRKPG
jgi:predicted methyltransferase